MSINKEQAECWHCEKVTDYTEEDIFISCDTVEGQYIEYEAAMCQYCSITIEIGYRTK